MSCFQITQSVQLGTSVAVCPIYNCWTVKLDLTSVWFAFPQLMCEMTAAWSAPSDAAEDIPNRFSAAFNNARWCAVRCAVPDGWCCCCRVSVLLFGWHDMNHLIPRDPLCGEYKGKVIFHTFGIKVIWIKIMTCIHQNRWRWLAGWATERQIEREGGIPPSE